MKKAIFKALTTELPISTRVAAPLVTGHTIYYRTRPAFDSVKYVSDRDRLTGYIKVLNLRAHGINVLKLIGPSTTNARGDIKLASLEGPQLENLMALIIKLAAC